MSAALDLLLETLTEPVLYALMHFLWQGALVALLLGGALVLLRPQSAALRYRLACAALLLMLLLPLGTATLYSVRHRDVPVEAAVAAPRSTTAATIRQLADARPVEETAGGLAGELLREVARHTTTPQKSRWILLAWLSGVGLFSLLHLGGWFRVQQLRRRHIEPVDPAWQERVDRLREAMGIPQAVRLLRSAAVEVPAVIGWLRPVVLMPVAALGGLPVEQLECILAHELAHIRRRDYLVNLLQTCAETLLFFHPAVWWVSRQIRHERENCCDDIAAEVTGSRLLYARALVELEETRRELPRLALGAGGGTLLRRVERLLGGPDMTLHLNRNLMAGTLAALLIVAAGAVLAVAAQSQLNELIVLPTTEAEETLSGRWYAETENGNLYLELRGRGDRRRDRWNITQRIPQDAFAGLEYTEDVEFTLQREAGSFVFRGDFDGMGRAQEGDGTFVFRADPAYGAKLEELGIRRVDEQQLVLLALQDLRIATIEEMDELGYGPFDDDEIVSMAIFEVTPRFVEEMNDLGFRNRRFQDLVALRVHGIDGEFVATMREEFGDHLDREDILQMKIHNISPVFVEEMRETFDEDMDHEELLACKIHGITPEYAEEMREAFGRHLDRKDILQMKIHGVRLDDLEHFRAMGYDLDADEAVAWRIHGVTQDFIDEMAELGYTNIRADDLVSLRIHGATPNWIRSLEEKGIRRLSVKELIRLRISGVRL